MRQIEVGKNSQYFGANNNKLGNKEYQSVSQERSMFILQTQTYRRRIAQDRSILDEVLLTGP
jgi:hypothetical protein